VDEIVLRIVFVLAALICGGIAGWFSCAQIRRNRLRDIQARASEITETARQDAEAIKKTAQLEARDEWRQEYEPLEKELEERKRSQRNLEDKLREREQQLDSKFDILDGKERDLLKTEKALEEREHAIEASEHDVQELVLQQRKQLEGLAGMTQPEARQMLIGQLEQSARQLAARRVREIKDHAIANANLEAKEIITRAIQRFSSELVVESSVSVVPLTSDDMKGRIIGRDGRNIRSFEMITGVEVIVDDTPGIVMLSAFDPLRREIAKNTLDKLIVDGRIHPGRIEEVYEKVLQDVEEMIRESGSKAAFDLGIHDMAEPLLELLGKLRFHTSYGQNLLAHSKEVGLLAGMMAESLELDITLARRAGLLHDIGKALGFEQGNDPSQSGAALARKCGEVAEVVQVIETLAKNAPSRSTLAALVEAANEISVHRPGARKDKVEEYTQRLNQIEEIASSHMGVRKAFALQNGKEVRILVDSEVVDDTYAEQLADEIVGKLEEQLDHPGQIRLSLVREVRAVHYAR
jgi:ribonuclease Y